MAVLRLLASGARQAEELITHRCGLEDIVDALGVVQSRTVPIGMGVVNP